MYVLLSFCSLLLSGRAGAQCAAVQQQNFTQNKITCMRVCVPLVSGRAGAQCVAVQQQHLMRNDMFVSMYVVLFLLSFYSLLTLFYSQAEQERSVLQEQLTYLKVQLQYVLEVCGCGCGCGCGGGGGGGGGGVRVCVCVCVCVCVQVHPCARTRGALFWQPDCPSAACNALIKNIAGDHATFGPSVIMFLNSAYIWS